ncbi:Crp/Fnr family transcriptional regulator [Pedobacter sp. SYSU D00535]|uniref:Crp/Fnr family transcriptional regulator n=1 Tax=Pedobacter sp. SYSU D00535 TaxID=2810308 RepID=UPI001A97489C|nr:Crp/Fnr family transcriptional regulator [Pedobacter sp. SYSU D00535]
MDPKSFENYKQYIRQISFLSDEDCDFFKEFLTKKTIAKSEFFLKAGKICEEIAFVESGCMRMFYQKEEKEINTGFFLANEFAVSYQSFLSESPSSYSIQALEDTELIVFHRSVLLRAYAFSKNWERFGRVIAEKIFVHSSQRIESFLFMNAEERYLQLLQQRKSVFEQIPLYHIASYLGLERESLSRLRKKLAKR